MAKIKDLKDSQLDEQIKKYEKILDQLYKEKEKRSGSTIAKSTKLKPKQIGRENDDSMYALSFDDQEISEMEQQIEEEKKHVKTNSVGVTQLLTLSKEQKEELTRGVDTTGIKKASKK